MPKRNPCPSPKPDPNHNLNLMAHRFTARLIVQTSQKIVFETLHSICSRYVVL